MENTFNFEQASYVDLLAEAQRLNGLVADLHGTATTASNKLMYVEKAFANRDRQYALAKEILTTLIEENEIENEEAVKQLIEIFDIEILKSVEFTLTIEVTGTIELPMGSELDEYSFTLESLSYNGDDVSIDHESISIDDWNFTE
jgi:hypothetical protein